ncbi:flagellar assembly protein FliW [Bacillus atrophaeus]|uniref:Flagellar assembly factor FliW n=1 Tax=Bacillus atrophaeus (strain 1942) TaxID=720555 RepID=A0ABN3ZEL2_BACA1|nr:flagellar assembly protein FliW [Bacillus atrophaeus]AMR61274.1 flagellar assembly protein FliW [Bacillus subtilis subsp. globigii]ADP34036.1 flagellar assembly protein FliW [Bacillus atrophaeus 1942]AIK45495.1 flagellar assembly factor FliW [Bacillus atrophaeus subsp. globigii]EIM10948.1 flagellar assembly protein FliW [Bacillus atrophaeus C89]KFK82748.1 flagellar assembly factor FliW [Bacillus atrophaeus]
MFIKTKYHGQTNVKKEQMIVFESGLPGFSEEKQFVILPLSEDSPFVVLQSVVTENLAFIVVSPFVFFKGYEFDLSESAAELLEIENIEDVEVMTILTMEEPFEKSTANLLAPIIVNRKNMLAKQVVLHNSSYTTKHPIGGESC